MSTQPEHVLPTVKLYTAGGDFVTELFNLPWKLRPELLVWGERFFIWREEHQQYREAMGTFWLDAVNRG